MIIYSIQLGDFL